MTKPIYLPPAGIDDFKNTKDPAKASKDWHDAVTSILSQVMKGSRKSPLFYDQLADTSGIADSAPRGVPWNGFPLRLDKWFAAGNSPAQQRQLANAAAETMLSRAAFGFFSDTKAKKPISLPFRIHDEYCEWHVDRDATGIRRISFTCEPPEYWGFLFGHDQDYVVKQYNALLRTTKVTPESLMWTSDVYGGDGTPIYKKGDYNPWNSWNTVNGAVHLTHPANSLFAEIQLASDSSLGWPVLPNGGGVDAEKLMGCAGVGGINRSSDPLILQGVYELAITGASVALFNPIGLYMSPLTLAGLLDPDGNPIATTAVKPIRQSVDGTRVLRLEIEPPGNYPLEKCTLDGEPLLTGAQVARAITMRLFAVAKKIPNKKLRKIKSCPSFVCVDPKHPDFQGTFGVGTVTCNQLTDADWAQEAFDIPDANPAALALPAPGPKQARSGRGLANLSIESE